MGQADQAVVSAEAAIGLRPEFAEAHISRGNALKTVGRLIEAAQSLEHAVRLKPDSAEAHTALGSVYQSLWRLEDAMVQHQEAARLWPDYPAAQLNLGLTLHAAGRPAEAMEWFERVIARHPTHDIAFGNLLNCAMYRDDLDIHALNEIHRRFGRAFAQTVPLLAKAEPQAADRRLKIGYLSSDLRNHPVAGNLLPVGRNHDHSAFEIHYYAHLLHPDAHTQDFKATADGWHDITRLSDAQAAEAIRADGIHILVSLAGRFDLNRPGICAWRAAPIQITMHDVATSGLAEMDYIIGDGCLLARPSTEYFSERRLRLPSFYIADFPDYLPPLPPVPRQGPVVFGCFNNPIKISPTLIPLWGAILTAVPDSRLVLKFHQAYGSVDLRSRLTQALTKVGARPDQLILISEEESFTAFISRYNQVDIALDTWPFSGSTTSFQALSMGVPVVTLATDRMASRWTASMLRRLRLDPLIANRPEDYVAVALQAVRDVEDWRGRRVEIRSRLAASSLCNGALYAKRLERLYRAIWRRYCKG
jgi:predicted O-linked N-acetylglucosamine transferase (SPINDLY family)